MEPFLLSFSGQWVSTNVYHKSPLRSAFANVAFQLCFLLVLTYIHFAFLELLDHYHVTRFQTIHPVADQFINSCHFTIHRTDDCRERRRNLTPHPRKPPLDRGFHLTRLRQTDWL